MDSRAEPTFRIPGPRTSTLLATLAVLSLSLACSRQVTATDTGVADAESGTGTSTGQIDSDSDSDSDSDGDSDTDTGAVPCTSEWDCGVGESCDEGVCACSGCGCWQAAPPRRIGIEERPSPGPFGGLDIAPPECANDGDCEPLEFCDGYSCIPTTTCSQDDECRINWDDRFCVDDRCRPVECDDDSICADDSICEAGRCQWLTVLPACAAPPSFAQFELGPISAPDQASLLVLDIDGDTADDLLVRDGDMLLVYRGQPGISGLGPATPWPLEPGVQLSSLARGDIHGDGQDELLIGHASPNGIEIVVVGELGQTLGFVATSEAPDQIVTVDADFDGWPDLITNSADEADPLDAQFMEALLGDGQGGFATVWTEDPQPFAFVGPFPLAWWESTDCVRVVASIEPHSYGDYVLGREVDGAGGQMGGLGLLERTVADASLVRATPTRAIALLTTTALESQGLLARRHVDDPWTLQLIQIDPSPGAVAFARVTVDDARSYAVIGHGSEPAGYVEFLGQALEPSCRGSFGAALDALDIHVGDFNADGREDLAIASVDGSLHVWLSSP